MSLDQIFNGMRLFLLLMSIFWSIHNGSLLRCDDVECCVRVGRKKLSGSPSKSLKHFAYNKTFPAKDSTFVLSF